MRTVVVIDEANEAQFRKILDTIKHCPNCSASKRRIEGQFIISEGESGEIYSSAHISVICDDCGFVRQFRKFGRLTGFLEEGFKKMFLRRGEA